MGQLREFPALLLCLEGGGPGAVIEAACLEVEPKKENVSPPLTRKDTILWGTSVTER